MNCKFCGKSISNLIDTCPYCGNSIDNKQDEINRQSEEYNTYVKDELNDDINNKANYNEFVIKMIKAIFSIITIIMVVIVGIYTFRKYKNKVIKTTEIVMKDYSANPSECGLFTYVYSNDFAYKVVEADKEIIGSSQIYCCVWINLTAKEDITATNLMNNFVMYKDGKTIAPSYIKYNSGTINSLEFTKSDTKQLKVYFKMDDKYIDNDDYIIIGDADNCKIFIA